MKPTVTFRDKTRRGSVAKSVDSEQDHLSSDFGLPPTSCVTLGDLLNFFVPQFSL